MPSEQGQRNRSVQGGIIAPWNNDTWLPYNITPPSTMAVSAFIAFSRDLLQKESFLSKNYVCIYRK